MQNNKPSVGGVWIFSGTAHFSIWHAFPVSRSSMKCVVSENLHTPPPNRMDWKFLGGGGGGGCLKDKKI